MALGEFIVGAKIDILLLDNLKKAKLFMDAFNSKE